jgi:hypothetical protein
MVGCEVTFYDILGIEKDATDEQIKSAWRSIAKETHPDRNDNDDKLTERFKQCKEAYETLVDPPSRETYDAQLRGPSIAEFMGSWVQAHQNEVHRRASEPKKKESPPPQNKKKAPKIKPEPSIYAKDQARLEREFGWTSDPSHYDSMMGKAEEDPTAQYDTPIDGLTSDDLLQALLSEAVLKAAMREESGFKVHGNKVEVKLSPDMTVTIDSHTVKNLRKVHRNLRQMERLVNGVKRWWRG